MRPTRFGCSETQKGKRKKRNTESQHLRGKKKERNLRMGKAIRSNKPIGQGRLGYDLRATRAMGNTVRLLRFFIRVIGTGFRVDMHSQQLYMESIEMGFMRDKVHKIGKLRMHKLVPVGTNVGKYEKGFYFNPENVLHS